MAKVINVKRNNDNTGDVFSVVMLDSEQKEGMTMSQKLHGVMHTLKAEAIKQTVKETADARIAQATADKAIETDL